MPHHIASGLGQPWLVSVLTNKWPRLTSAQNRMLVFINAVHRDTLVGKAAEGATLMRCRGFQVSRKNLISQVPPILPVWLPEADESSKFIHRHSSGCCLTVKCWPKLPIGPSQLTNQNNSWIQSIHPSLWLNSLNADSEKEILVKVIYNKEFLGKAIRGVRKWDKERRLWWQNNVPVLSPDVHLSTPRAYEDVALYGKKELKLQMELLLPVSWP